MLKVSIEPIVLCAISILSCGTESVLRESASASGGHEVCDSSYGDACSERGQIMFQVQSKKLNAKIGLPEREEEASHLEKVDNVRIEISQTSRDEHGEQVAMKSFGQAMKSFGKTRDEKSAMHQSYATNISIPNGFATSNLVDRTSINSERMSTEQLLLFVWQGNGTILSRVHQAIEYEFRQPPQPPRDKVILSVIVALQWGYFGIDRCFLGSIFCGILKCGTCGGCGLWFIIDYIILVYNILTLSKSIDVFGFKATFDTKSIDHSFYAFLIVWTVNSLLLLRARTYAPVSEGVSCARRNGVPFTPAIPFEWEVQTIFKKFDADGNGKLDTEEFARAVIYLGIPSENIDMYKTLMDADGDGQIDISEWLQAFRGGLLEVKRVQR